MQSAADGDAVTIEWNALCAAAGDVKTIADEYAALFVSIGRPQVELYASWYLTGFLMEKPLAQLRDDLLALGLARHDGQHDSEDHMAGELEVMRHLLLREDGAQRAFFQRHLQPWYDKFCTALEEAADANFYRTVARFMRAFLDMERDYFRLQAGDGGVK
jgi:TorA maturation chaperone TorD